MTLTDPWFSTKRAFLRAQEARLGALDMLKANGLSDTAYDALRRLLGVPLNFNLISNMTLEHVKACELLAGPYGYVIYKAMMARRGGNDCE